MRFVSNMLSMSVPRDWYCTEDLIKNIPHEPITIQEFMEELESICNNIVYVQGRETEYLRLFYMPQLLGWTISHHKIGNAGATEIINGIRLDKDDLWLAIEYTKRVVGYSELKEELE